MLSLIGQAAFAGASIGQIAIYAIVVLAVVAIVYAAAKAMDVPIPSWVIRFFWIIVIAFVAIMAVKLVVSF